MEDLVQDIERARAWLEHHFNAYRNEDETPSNMLAKQTWKVTYPDVDKALVVPVLFGKPSEEYIGAKYRIAWVGGKLYWRGGPVIRPDVIVDLEVT